MFYMKNGDAAKFIEIKIFSTTKTRCSNKFFDTKNEREYAHNSCRKIYFLLLLLFLLLLILWPGPFSNIYVAVDHVREKFESASRI